MTKIKKLDEFLMSIEVEHIIGKTVGLKVLLRGDKHWLEYSFTLPEYGRAVFHDNCEDSSPEQYLIDRQPRDIYTDLLVEKNYELP